MSPQKNGFVSTFYAQLTKVKMTEPDAFIPQISYNSNSKL